MNPIGNPEDPSIPFTDEDRDLAWAVYTIYQEPEDIPDAKMAVREWIVPALGLGEPMPSDWVRTGDTLQEVRGEVPVGADVRLSRRPDDPPSIVENWF